MVEEWALSRGGRLVASVHDNGAAHLGLDRRETDMLTWAGKDWVARVGPRGRALDVVRAHIAAEVDTRTDVIMSTVSADPWFPLLDRLPTGLTLTVVEGTAEVTAYYAARSE